MTRLLQSAYWRGNIRQLKNLAEQMAVIEMDHQISAETLRKYLPKEENQSGLVLRSNVESQGKDYAHEIGLLYNMVMQNRKELQDLREQIQHGAAQMVETIEPNEVVEAEAEEVGSLRIEDGERERIKRALELSGGNRKVAAETVGLSERTLYRKIKEYGL